MHPGLDCPVSQNSVTPSLAPGIQGRMHDGTRADVLSEEVGKDGRMCPSDGREMCFRISAYGKNLLYKITGNSGERKLAHFDGALIRLDQSVEHFEESGLARAIAADEADAFAAAEFEGDVLVGPEFSRAEGGRGDWRLDIGYWGRGRGRGLNREMRETARSGRGGGEIGYWPGSSGCLWESDTPGC